MGKKWVVLALGIFLIMWCSFNSNAAANGQWKNSNGWWFEYADGSYAQNEYIDGYWINSSGYYDSAWNGQWKSDRYGWWFESGSWYPTNQWLKIDGDWYYFKSSGYMASNEWVGNYYMTGSGIMAVDTWIGDYYVGSDGAWIPNYSKEDSDKKNTEDYSKEDSGKKNTEDYSKEDSGKKNTEDYSKEDSDKKKSEDYSNVKKTWVLQDGYYTAGVDIPSGVFNVKPIVGGGYLSSPQCSANLVPDYVEEEYAIGYSRSYTNFILDYGEVLEVSGLEVSLEYTQVTSNYTGRKYNEAGAIELTSGNFFVGKDIPAGKYIVKFVSGGAGTVTTSYNKDVDYNEYSINSNMSGDPHKEYSLGYFNLVSNVALTEGEVIQVSSGLVVSFIPIVE